MYTLWSQSSLKLLLKCFLLMNGILFFSNAFAIPNLINTVSVLAGGEQDFRNMDHATYFIAGLELNDFYIRDCYFVELDNLFSGGEGDYYILNGYSVPGTYRSDMYKYVVRLTAGALFFPQPDSVLALGAGIGYRYLRYRATYNQAGIGTVYNRYIEFFFPLEINYNAPLCGDYSFSFNNIIPIGIRGKMSHMFKGPSGFVQPSYHATIGIMSSLLLNYRSFSFGPWASYDYFTTGFFNGHPTVTSGNQLKIVEFGLKGSWRF